MRVVYLRSPQITNCFDPFDWFPEERYWSGLDEAPSGTREDYRDALRDINGVSTFTQLVVVDIYTILLAYKPS